MEAAVIEYLSKLSPDEVDLLVARARVAARPIEPTPPSIVPPAPAAPEPAPVIVHASEAPPPPIAFRPTLKSADLEVVDEPSPAARPTPPPLPPRATTPPPPPVVIAVAPPAPVLELVIEGAIETPTPMPAAAAAAADLSPQPVSGTTMTAPVATVILAPEPERVAPPTPAPARLSIPEITDLLFDAMTDLPFCDTAVEGGAYCLTSILRALPSLAGIVSLFDPEVRELVIVYAQGPRADRLLMTRFASGDALVARAVETREPIIESYGADAGAGAGAGAPRERHAAFGEPWSVVVAPVMRGGRLLGTIELVDPIDGSPFDDRARDALRYVAAQWAELIAERGIRLPRLVAPPTEEASA